MNAKEKSIAIYIVSVILVMIITLNDKSGFMPYTAVVMVAIGIHLLMSLQNRRRERELTEWKMSQEKMMSTIEQMTGNIIRKLEENPNDREAEIEQRLQRIDERIQRIDERLQGMDERLSNLHYLLATGFKEAKDSNKELVEQTVRIKKDLLAQILDNQEELTEVCRDQIEAILEEGKNAWKTEQKKMQKANETSFLHLVEQLTALHQNSAAALSHQTNILIDDIKKVASQQNKILMDELDQLSGQIVDEAEDMLVACAENTETVLLEIREAKREKEEFLDKLWSYNATLDELTSMMYGVLRTRKTPLKK